MIRTIETRNLTDHAYSQCKVYVTEKHRHRRPQLYF